jgi:lipopolysaccharide transport system permease protein
VSTLDTTASPPIADEPRIRIRPPRGWGDLRLREIWDARELVYFLTKREIQIRYKQSFFGLSWAVLQPLALAFIFALFFGVLAKVPSQDLPYPVFSLAGLVPWLFTAQAVSAAASSLVTDANLLSKIYFPRMAVPLGKILSLLLDLIIALGVVIVFTLAYGVPIELTILVTPAFLALGALTAFGPGLLLAAINVKYRDVTLAVPTLVQSWFFATPVLYPVTLVTGVWEYIYGLNPMVSVIAGVRWCMLGTEAPALGTIAVSVASALLILGVALAYFRRTEQFFADLI